MEDRIPLQRRIRLLLHEVELAGGAVAVHGAGLLEGVVDRTVAVSVHRHLEADVFVFFLDRFLQAQGYYPPINVLPSLSRLMKDGIGEGYTRADHAPLANQLFASYAKVIDARSLASVIGEEELSDIDKKYIEFGRTFEEQFINQGDKVNRSIDESLDLGWHLLSILPRSELERVDDALLDQYYEASE